MGSCLLTHASSSSSFFSHKRRAARDLTQAENRTQNDQATSSLAPQCGQLQQSPIISIQTRLDLCRGLPACIGMQPEGDYISFQELELVQSCLMWRCICYLMWPPVSLLRIVPPSSIGSFLGSTWLFQIHRSFRGILLRNRNNDRYSSEKKKNTIDQSSGFQSLKLKMKSNKRGMANSNAWCKHSSINW